MVEYFTDPHTASRWCATKRQQDKSIGLVPTMGALHDGHLALVKRAVAENDICVVSIFVNPLQFNSSLDYQNYPRDIIKDKTALEHSGCAMAFSGELLQFFPEVNSQSEIAMPNPGRAALGLEGEHRPGHFAGVRTIVERLFAITSPTRAYFGAKDFQQTLVIQELAAELGSPAIAVCDTVREPSGLAKSSRNQLLTTAERREASVIFNALMVAKGLWQAGERDAECLRLALHTALNQSALELEYAELRDPHCWSETRPQGTLQRAQALIAARLNKVRLIDNMRLDE